jgi:hypothetical protein
MILIITYNLVEKGFVIYEKLFYRKTSEQKHSRHSSDEYSLMYPVMCSGRADELLFYIHCPGCPFMAGLSGFDYLSVPEREGRMA